MTKREIRFMVSFAAAGVLFSLFLFWVSGWDFVGMKRGADALFFTIVNTCALGYGSVFGLLLSLAYDRPH